MEANTLKLTTDDKGIVWFLHNEQLPKSSQYNISDFLKSNLWKLEQRIQVAGSVFNARLLKELFEMRLKEEFGLLEVCSPFCSDSFEPDRLLFNMRRCHTPVSAGGWHIFTIKDYVSYAIAATYKDSNKYSDYIANLISAHPIWPYMSFIEGIDPESFSLIVADTLDPRWHTDVGLNYTEGANFSRFLGVANKVPTNTDTSLPACRFRLLLKCWKGDAPKDIIKNNDPRTFLWRTWFTNKGGDSGDLAATRRFAEYLRLIWLMVLCDTAQAPHLFVPKYFFDNAIEVEAFYSHVKKHLV